MSKELAEYFENLKKQTADLPASPQGQENRQVLAEAVKDMPADRQLHFYIGLVAALTITAPVELFAHAVHIAGVAAPMVEQDFPVALTVAERKRRVIQ